MTRSEAAPADIPRTLPAQRDGRIALALILLTYFAGLLAGSWSIPLSDLWNKLQVPALDIFGDLLYITRDGERTLHGLPRTPGFFYPPACYWFAYLGLGERHNLVLGILLSIGFFAALLLALGRVRREHVAYYAALLCSPSIMLGVARGNIDLLVFILLVAALFLLQSQKTARMAAGYGLILYAGMLKLYPIVAAAVALREKRSRWIGIGLALALLFGVYLWFSLDDLREMNQTAPRNAFLSYGAGVTFDRFRFGNPNNPKYGFALSLPLAAIALFWGWKKGGSFRRATLDAWQLDAFRMGAVIYLSCFALIQYNFVYRHITLMLTVPLWLTWRSSGGRVGKTATVALATLLLAFWLPRYVRNFWNLDQLCDWVLFALYAFAFGAMLQAEPQRTEQSHPAAATVAA